LNFNLDLTSEGKSHLFESLRGKKSKKEKFNSFLPRCKTKNNLRKNKNQNVNDTCIILGRTRLRTFVLFGKTIAYATVRNVVNFTNFTVIYLINIFIYNSYNTYNNSIIVHIKKMNSKIRLAK
jgi:hypothetical protein